MPESYGAFHRFKFCTEERDGGHSTRYFHIKRNGRKQGCSRFYQGHTGSQFLPDLVSNLMKAIAAVIVLVGAFNVYFKMQNGDQDVKKTIMLTIGGCIAFIALSEALPLFFQ